LGGLAQCIILCICLYNQGVKSCRAAPKEVFDASKYIFVAPPGVQELDHRLRKRGGDSEAVIERRVKEAAQEIDEATRLNWDMWIVNDNFHDAYRRVK
jgi:guanylate kinase